MFQKVGSHHNDGINYSQSDQNFAVGSASVQKMQGNKKYKKHKRINGRKKIECTFEIAFEKHHKGTLRTASEAVETQEFFRRTGDHVVFGGHQVFLLCQ